MKKLPKSLNMATLLAMSPPPDVTLDVVKSHFMHGDVGRALAGKVKPHKQIRIRFVMETEPETECPDSMTLAEFRELANALKAYISIDDLDGGLPVREPETV